MTSQTRHSPGPWCKEAYEGHDIVDVYDANGFRVAICHYYAPHQDRHIEFSQMLARVEREVGVCQANARLIAAAPDLLAALKMLREIDDAYGFDLDEPQRDQMHDAIAKAEGRS